MKHAKVTCLVTLSADIVNDLVHPQLYATLGLIVLLNLCSLVPAIRSDDPGAAAADKGVFMPNYFTTYWYMQVQYRYM